MQSYATVDLKFFKLNKTEAFPGRIFHYYLYLGVGVVHDSDRPLRATSDEPEVHA